MNPYESPAAAQNESVAAAPHGTSIRKEAWRGAKFGARLTACSLGAIMAIVFLFFAGAAFFRGFSGGSSPIRKAEFWELMIGLFGGGAMGIAVTSAWGAVAGAMIMSVAAIVRRARGDRGK